MLQLSLLQETTIKKTIKTLPINQLLLSEFNPRYSRNDDDIDRLAQRISRNGFEITRAVWAYQNGDGYKVFAGGTRLEAAKRAGCKNVPVVIHEDLTDEDIVRLADEDNENDEYHSKVSPVDVWAHYAYLEGLDWTQQRIAEAKGLKDTTWVSRRLKFHKLPERVKAFLRQDLITEGHLSEISALCVDASLVQWLTPSQVWEELAQKAVHDKGKNGSKSVRAVKEDVDQWREFIEEAEKTYNKFDKDITLYDFGTDPPSAYLFDAQNDFVGELARSKARSLSAVKSAARNVKLFIKENFENYETYIKEKSLEAAKEAIQAEHEAKLLSRFIQADCLDVLDNWTFGPIQLLLIDPPYGKDYQSNRRWKSKAPEKIKGDTEQEAMELLEIALKKTLPILSDDSHTLTFCDWRKEPEVRQIIEQAGLTIKGSLIWTKEEHSAGDVKGAFGPSHERIIHAVKGSPEVSPRIRDVLDFARSRETSHPTEKPTALLEKLINSTTNEGDLVVDLFAGCASTLVASMRLSRLFAGVEIDQIYHEEGCTRILKELGRNG